MSGECECTTCERIMLTSKDSNGFVCDVCVMILVAYYRKNPEMKPKQ